MPKRYITIMIWLVMMHIIMIAEAMPTSTEPDTTSVGSGGTGSIMTLSKVFGYSTKLTKDNFDIWVAGLISAVTGLTVTLYKQLEITFKYLKDNGHLDLTKLEVELGAALSFTAAIGGPTLVRGGASESA